MATITLTTGSTWTVPVDWNSGVNTIECYGGGGGGSACGSATGVLDGGGAGAGGAYAKIVNFAATAGQVKNISIGAKGTKSTFTGGPSAAGTNGGDTWFNSTATVLAKGGTGGGAAGSGSGGLGGSGGTIAASVGTTKHAGGNGGNGASGTPPSDSGGPGYGGGAGGPTSDGGVGSNATGTTNFGSPGAGGGGNAGAGGGAFAPGNNYGGGGCGGDGTSGGSGFDGAQGVIVITYTPLVAVALTATNLATSSPAFGTPALTQKQAFTATALASSSPSLATPAFTQKQALGPATTLVTSSPTFGTPFVGAVYSLTPLPLATGSPYLGNAWPFQAIDSGFVLLCHCDGFDGSTSVPDTSGRNHPVSLFGTASLDVGLSKFGVSSLSAALDIEGGHIQLDGSNDFAFGTGDFTVDLWIHPQSLPSTKNSVIYDNRDSSHPNNGRLLIDSMSVPGTNTLKVIGATGGLFSATSLATGSWYHVAVVRASGIVKLYVNGTSEGGSLADTTDYASVPAARPVFGTDASALPSLANGYLGYIDEIRVSKGVARWTNDFSVPQAPYGYLFDPNDIATSSPVFGTPGGTNGLFANNLATSSPTFGTPALTHFYAIPHALDLVTGSPSLGVGFPLGVLRAVNLVPASPVVPVDPTLHQHPQVLAHALDLVTDSPDLGEPSRIPSPPPFYPDDLDRHVRRSGDDYAGALIDLLPKGQAWPRDPGSTLIQALTGLARFYGYVDGRAADLLERESDPRATLELLPDWERAWGLPDPCFKETTTIGERRDMLVMVMTLLGGQSRDFFYSVATWMGYSIFIEEYSPFMCGISRCGDTTALYDGVHPRWQIGRPEMRFYWTIHITNASLNWFRASQGQAGVDPHLRIGLFIDQDCIFRRWKPAHTDIVYSYSNLQQGHSMDGTP